MNIVAYMMSCADRESTRNRTLADLAMTDWNDEVRVQLDRSVHDRLQSRQEDTAHDLLRRAVSEQSPFFLFLEDDLEFNRHLRHNLEHWPPMLDVPAGGQFFGSVYNPTIQRCWTATTYFVAEPDCVYGSQAFLLSAQTARHIVEHWSEVVGLQDIKMSRLAAQLCPIHYHVPSLVQHVGTASTWGGVYHAAVDFERDWKA
jgi:hypothetical protein